MKQTIVKLTILALYATCVWAVLSIPDLFSGVTRLVVLFVLSYCGLIVLAHLVAFWNSCWRWSVAASREQRQKTCAETSVVFETETEAI